MKVLSRILHAVLILALAAGITACDKVKTISYIDAYTSASEVTSKAPMSGEAFEAVAKVLEAGSSDLANAATAKAAGYMAPKSFIVNIMSVNPDGSVGISTISQWAYAIKDGPDNVTLQLTHGQNALNLSEVGKRGTLFIPGVLVDGKSWKYFLHLKVVRVDVLKYSDEAFETGKFNSYYSGKAAQKNQYTITCEVLSIEEVSGSVKLVVQFP